MSCDRGRTNDGSHLESLDALGPGRRIFKKCALARWRPNGDKIKCHVKSQILTNRSLNLCNNSDQTLFSNTLTFARSLGRMLKTSAYGLGIKHLHRDLANVNAWKTMFDPYIKYYSLFFLFMTFYVA